MKNKKLFFLVLSLLLTINMLFAQKFEVPKIEQYKLNNGLTVILCEDHTLPEAFGAVVVKVGSKDDPADATGLAHYLEHMMFKGTQNTGTTDWEKEKPHYEKVLELYDQLAKSKDKKQIDALQKQINEASMQQAAFVVPNEYFKLLSEIGANGINAGTSYDMTQYYSMFPAIQIEKWLNFYSNSFQNPVFRSFQAELETVYEEYNMYKDRQASRLNEEIMSYIFPSSPYGRPIIGLGEHLKKPSLQKLIEFYNTYYVPSNMALVLCGDFTINDVKPYIESTFGKWEAKPYTNNTITKEAPFKGRKEITIKTAPYAHIQLAYRTVPENDPDTEILNVCQRLLRNGQTGFIDRYITDGVFTMANVNNNTLKNEGIMTLVAVPNPQAFYDGNINPSNIRSLDEYKRYVREMEHARNVAIKETENKLVESLQNLIEGAFTDKMLDGVKNMMINNYISLLESGTGKGMQLASLFVYDNDLNDYLNYVERVKAITKDDVKRVAKKYFGKDYLVFNIKQGRGKVEKLDKPQIEPLKFETTGESVFAQQFRSMKSPEPNIRFIDFQNDAQQLALKNGDNFYYTQNPINDIFSLTIRFDCGIGTMKELSYAYLMNHGGAGGFSPQVFKSQMNNLNCTYSVSVNDSYVTISLRGPEENFKQAANLINLLINKPSIYQNIVSSVMESENINRRYEKTEPSVLNNALMQYVLYGDKSPYIDRLPLRAVAQIKSQEVVEAFKRACGYSATIFCTGGWSTPTQAKNAFEEVIQLSDKPIKGVVPFIRPKNTVTENTIYFVNSSDSKQSQISIFTNQPEYAIEQDPIISAFNNYFSGGFNGIMLQEIREKRSMAYGASARYVKAQVPGKDSHFTGDLQTQDDKTYTAINVFWDLIHNMPQHPERIDAIKEYLTWTAVLQTPSFRSVGNYIDYNRRLGYDEDPSKIYVQAYKNLTFEDITKFWNENIKDKPMAITIVGDKSRVNLKELAKLGKIVELQPSVLFSKDDM